MALISTLKDISAHHQMPLFHMGGEFDGVFVIANGTRVTYEAG